MTAAGDAGVGTRFPPRSFGPVTRTDLVRYAGASGDLHPNHHDDGYARAAGFPSVFAMGMFQASVLASYAVECLGPQGWRRYRVRFRAQVWPGDILTCRGSITGASEGVVTAEFECSSEAGVVVTAVVEVNPL